MLRRRRHRSGEKLDPDKAPGILITNTGLPSGENHPVYNEQIQGNHGTNTQTFTSKKWDFTSRQAVANVAEMMKHPSMSYDCRTFVGVVQKLQEIDPFFMENVSKFVENSNVSLDIRLSW